MRLNQFLFFTDFAASLTLCICHCLRKSILLLAFSPPFYTIDMAFPRAFVITGRAGSCQATMLSPWTCSDCIVENSHCSCTPTSLLAKSHKAFHASSFPSLCDFNCFSFFVRNNHWIFLSMTVTIFLQDVCCLCKSLL